MCKMLPQQQIQIATILVTSVEKQANKQTIKNTNSTCPLKNIFTTS